MGTNLLSGITRGVKKGLSQMIEADTAWAKAMGIEVREAKPTASLAQQMAQPTTDADGSLAKIFSQPTQETPPRREPEPIPVKQAQRQKDNDAHAKQTARKASRFPKNAKSIRQRASNVLKALRNDTSTDDDGNWRYLGKIAARMLLEGPGTPAEEEERMNHPDAEFTLSYEEYEELLQDAEKRLSDKYYRFLTSHGYPPEEADKLVEKRRMHEAKPLSKSKAPSELQTMSEGLQGILQELSESETISPYRLTELAELFDVEAEDLKDLTPDEWEALAEMAAEAAKAEVE